MEPVTELRGKESRTWKTQVWVTKKGLKEYEKIKHADLLALFEGRAEKGFKDFRGPNLRKEGNDVWAFGTPTWTTRIAGFFEDKDERKRFVICGVWDGKPRKRKRPKYADIVVARCESIKADGVKYDAKEEQEDDEQRED